jgi:uncharacterized protein HemX
VISQFQFQFQPQRTTAAHSRRQGGDTGALRMLLLAFALIMPLATLAYLQIQQTRLSYEMSEIRNQMNAEEERRRTLLLERSFYQRSEAVKEFADQLGMEPRKLPSGP